MSQILGVLFLKENNWFLFLFDLIAMNVKHDFLLTLSRGKSLDMPSLSELSVRVLSLSSL
jgi:hypothetical protein